MSQNKDGYHLHSLYIVQSEWYGRQSFNGDRIIWYFKINFR